MKKTLLLTVALILTGLNSAMAAIDDELRTIITKSDGIELTEVTNDANNPWTIADGVATSTVGKMSSATSQTFTIKFRATGRTIFSYGYTADFYPYGEYDRKIVTFDDNTLYSNYSSYTTKSYYTHYFILDEGEHTITFTHKHSHNDNNYTQVMTVSDVAIYTVESQMMTIDLAAPGTLGVEALNLVNTLPAMQFLRLSGKLNADDWNSIKNMTGLKCIDLTNAQITDIPDNAFSSSQLRFVDLPTCLKTIGAQAFYKRYLTGKLTLPATLEKIGTEAFAYNNITEVEIPDNVTFMDTHVFRDNQKLITAKLGTGLTSLNTGSFYNCEALKTVTGGANVKTIYGDCFRYCAALETASDLQPRKVESSAFAGAKTLQSFNFADITDLGSSAFQNCQALKSVELPKISYMSSTCFNDCSSITTVKLGDKIRYIPSDAFSGCSSLEEVVMGSSVRELGSYCFYITSGSLKRVYLAAPAPPSTSTSPFYRLWGVTLYVPDYAMISYKQHSYWSQFTSVDSNPNPAGYIDLYGKLELSTNSRIPNNPDITMNYQGGSTPIKGILIVNGNNPQSLGNYYHWANSDNCPVTISRCNQMTAASVKVNHYLAKNYWYYITMPFDVKRSDITISQGAVAVRYYDADSRAQNGAGNNWKDVADDDILREGQGYIFCASDNSWCQFTASDDTRNHIFKSHDVTLTLQEHASSVSNDANWNLVGNPYPSFFDIYYMDYTAPITLWDTDNRTFTAKSVADDQVALRPFQAFFVQKPTLISELTFRTDGRQATKTIDRSAAAPRMTPVVASRHFVELAITDGSTTDLTRVVVNHAASDDFCADNDATKMMADGTTPQIYTHASGDIYAINEGANQSGSVKVGVQIAHSGTYTITMPRNDVRARLYDYGVEVELPYTFAADEGVEDNRFTIGFDTTTTGIDAIKPGAQTDGAIYTLDGIRVSTTAPKGIYIQNHKKIVK